MFSWCEWGISYAFKTGFNWKRTNRQRSSQEKRERGKGRAKEMTENSKKQCREVDLARARERLEKREEIMPSNAVKQIERGPEKRNKITKKLRRWANEKISPVRFWPLLQEVSCLTKLRKASLRCRKFRSLLYRNFQVALARRRYLE